MLGSASFTVFVDLPFVVLFLFVLYYIGGPVAAIPGLIVPAQSDMLVRAKLLPQDIADVSVRQTVRVSLSAYDVSRYGSLEGVVKKHRN